MPEERVVEILDYQPPKLKTREEKDTYVDWTQREKRR